MSDWANDMGFTPEEAVRYDEGLRVLNARIEAARDASSSVGIGRERAGDCAAIPTTSARRGTDASPASVASAVRPHEPADAPPALRWGWRYAQDGLWQLVLEDVA